MKTRKRRKLKTWVKIVLAIIIICIIILIFKGFRTNKTNNNKNDSNKKVLIKKNIIQKEESNELSMVMTGDCLLHKPVYSAALQKDGTYSFKSMFEYISPLIKGKDLAYYNQESIIGGKSLGLSSYPRFNSPEEIGDDMVDMGFNMVSLANNHTMDKNEVGVINSVNYWKTKPGVYYTGQALSEEDRENNIKIKEKNGIKYAFFSYTTVTNGLLPSTGKEYLTNIYSDEKAKKDIEKVKGKVDLIIVAMHWGVEYTNNETEEQKKIASYLSSLGVNLIIGTHPHVIQPITYVNDTLVFYSLGNFISSQDSPDKLTGAIASLTINKKNNKITFKDVKVNLIYTFFIRYSPYNYKLYPYEMVDTSILSSYKTYYEKYKTILTKEDSSVEVASIQ